MREMTFPATISQGFRIVIPKSVRETLNLKKGEVIEVTVRRIKEEASSKPVLVVDAPSTV